MMKAMPMAVARVRPHLIPLLLLLTLPLAAAVVTARSLPLLRSEAGPASPPPSCLASCDAANPPNIDDPLVTVCGTDGQSHTSSVAALLCYFNCNVGVTSAGPCGCPNNCTTGYRGECSTTTSPTSQVTPTCACYDGWGGADCNSVVCPQNGCSGHGQCVPATAAAPAMCACDEGWAGPACEAGAFPAALGGDLPWGCVGPPRANGPRPSAQQPRFCQQPPEQTPWFDFTGIPHVRVALEPGELASLFDPWQAYSEAWRAANITYVSTSRNESRVFHGAGIRLKGSSSRVGLQKSFKLRFKPEDDEEDAHGHDWPVLSLKTDLNLVGGQFITTLLQTVGSPNPRSFFTVLYVNGVLYGVYSAFGDFTKDLIDSSYAGAAPNASARGTWYKAGFPIAPLSAVGLDHLKPLQKPGTPSPYLEMAAWVSNASDSTFAAEIANRLDIDGFARAAVVASFVCLIDTIVPVGNNYQWFDAPSIGVRWSLTLRDYDGVFSPLAQSFVPLFLDSVPLGRRLMLSPDFVGNFSARYREMLAAVFGDETGPKASVSARRWYEAFAAFLGPVVALDSLRQVTHGPSYNFETLVVVDAAALPGRAQQVLAQLQWLEQAARKKK